MRFLCLSDIHGHLDRLDAVLAHADLRGWDKLLVCGDSCFPGPRPLGVWQRLREHHAVVTQGLADRAVASLAAASLRPSTPEQLERRTRLLHTQQELGELNLAQLARLPLTSHLTLEDGTQLLLVHGSPLDPAEPFSFELTDEELTQLMAEDPSELVICGGSHVAFDRALEGLRIVNVGSVGENPTPGYAHATLLETTRFGFEVTQYDVEL